MTDLPLYTADACREIDAKAMQPVAAGGLCISGQVLMQRAAQFALDTLLSRCPNARLISIVCGKGNNAGDGYWVALLAKQLGLDVQLIAVGTTQQLTGDALIACQRATAAGIFAEAADSPIRSSVVVDALLGTGIRGTPRPGYAEAIEAINAVKPDNADNADKGFVLSIDLPSGLDADTGAATLAVKADVTVSFIARKIGLYTGKGPALCGERLFDDLGVSKTLASPHPSVPLRRWRGSLMPALPLDAFKQQRGHVLIVGGCKGMGGAAILAGEAALRSGAGLVTVATHEANLSGLLARVPEAMWVDPLGTDAEQALPAALSRASVVVLGPGLGRGAWAQRVLAAMARYDGPLVVDADGLYWLADPEHSSALRARKATLFLTPHVGEAARLLQRSADEILRDPPQAVIDMVEQFDATCLLKGPGTVIGTSEGLAICGHGNPGMASAGMGDVLAGLVGSMIAQQPSSSDAAFATAVLLHSAAADQAAIEIGMRGLTAGSIITHISALLRQEQGV